MKDMGVVYGSGAQAKPVVRNVDTVYVHSNIRKITEPDENGQVPNDLYSYNEVQYTIEEWEALSDEEKARLEQG